VSVAIVEGGYAMQSDRKVGGRQFCLSGGIHGYGCEIVGSVDKCYGSARRPLPEAGVTCAVKVTGWP